MMPFLAGVGATAIVAAAAFWFMSPTVAPNSDPQKVEQWAKENLPTEVLIPTDQKERLAYAFQVATGKSGPFSEKVGSDRYQVSPIRLIDLPFGPALLVKREVKDGCHGCSGYIGVYYLQSAEREWTLTASYPEAVVGSDWRNAPDEWKVSTKFTSNPAIVSNDGYMGQGITVSSMAITELTESGPVTSDLIRTGFDNEGQVDPNDPDFCSVEGTVRNVVKDKSIEVVVSGSVTGVDRYQKIKGKFVAQHSRDWDSPCLTPEYRDPYEDEGSGYVDGY